MLKLFWGTVRQLLDRLRVVLLGLGLAGTAFLVIATWKLVNAQINYHEAEATVIVLERGCLADGADRDKVNPVFKCAKKEGAKREPFQKPYVTFEFVTEDGTLARFQRLIGEVGAPDDAFQGQHFSLMYDPANPRYMSALPGLQYFTRVLPVGLVGLLLMGLYFKTRRVLAP